MKLRKHVNSEMDKKRVSSEAGGSQKKSRLSAAACVGVSLILWGYLRWFGPGQDMQLAGGLVEREDYGGTQKEQELIVSGLGEEEQTVTVKISPRVYTKEEADDVFYGAMEQLGEQILGENESLDAVTENLVLPSISERKRCAIRCILRSRNYYLPQV